MIEKKVREKIVRLIEKSDAVADGVKVSNKGKARATAWVTEAQNVAELAVPDQFHTYRSQIKLSAMLSLDGVDQQVLTVAELLRSLLGDIDAGLVATLANAIRAETFADFLEHAVAYRKEGRKNEAGVIAGVVFEDTIRKIYADKIRTFSRPELEQVIIALSKNQVISEEEAKQARVAAHVRTKATHADWSAFSEKGVDDTIRFTRALIETHLK